MHMKVYLGDVSGNSYKLRILLSLLKAPHEVVIIDLKNKQHKSAEFLKINPRGEVPALEDGGKVLWDSAACLVYIARKHGGEQWLPTDAAGMAEVMQWIALAATEIQCGFQYARRGVSQGRWTLGPLEDGQAFGKVALEPYPAVIKWMERCKQLPGWAAR